MPCGSRVRPGALAGMNPKPARDPYPLPHFAVNHHHRDVIWETAAVVFGVLTFGLLCHALYMIFVEGR
jgi:hypothetical protein